jgi:hypothetical protein
VVASTVVYRHVEVDNISILKLSKIRDAVANNLINRRTQTFGEVVIVEW